jgi:hypothetical protein
LFSFLILLSLLFSISYSWIMNHESWVMSQDWWLMIDDSFFILDYKLMETNRINHWQLSINDESTLKTNVISNIYIENLARKHIS